MLIDEMYSLMDRIKMVASSMAICSYNGAWQEEDTRGCFNGCCEYILYKLPIYEQED